jgi:UDP-3-O-[3-hydroxymyristoyl] glucosamine N-acyltransferase
LPRRGDFDYIATVGWNPREGSRRFEARRLPSRVVPTAAEPPISDTHTTPERTPRTVAHHLRALAAEFHAVVRGFDDVDIVSAEPFEKATPGSITFVADLKLLKRMAGCRATACFVSPAAAVELPDDLPLTLLVVADPQDAFLKVLARFRPMRARPKLGVSPLAYVSPKATVGADCNIYPHAFVDDDVVIGDGCDIHPGVTIARGCRIGAGCVLHPRVALYEDTVLEERVIVHAGAVLGADGFGYRFRQGRFEKIPQLGSVRIEKDCEIGANTTIDRGMIGATVIGEGTKLDNLVMIGHNCELGKHNAFASQVGLAGSVTTGDYVRCAGQVGIADHLHLGTGCTLGAKSGVHRDIPAGETHVGYPAVPEQDAFKVAMATQKTPEMRKQIRQLEQTVEQLGRQFTQLKAAG